MPRQRLTETTYRLNLRRGRWFIDYTDPSTGRTRSVSTGTADKAVAKVFLDQWLAGRSQPVPAAQLRIEEILDGYSKARDGKIASRATMAFSIKSLVRHVGNLTPDMLMPQTYLEARSKDRVRGGRITGGTIRREVGVLRAALAWAVKQKWLTAAPFIEAPGVSAPRERWLSRADVDKLIQYAEMFHMKVFIGLGYHTAARMGAILDLTWDRVDFEHLRISYDRPGRQQSKKRRAVVPINPVALSLLQSAKGVAVSDHVIEWRGKPIRTVKRGFAEACRRAGVKKCSPHILRHTAATHMVMAGVPLAEIARFLGDSEAMVEKVYGKHSPDFLRGAASALAGPVGPRENVALGIENVATSTETTPANPQKPHKIVGQPKVVHRIPR